MILDTDTILKEKKIVSNPFLSLSFCIIETPYLHYVPARTPKFYFRDAREDEVTHPNFAISPELLQLAECLPDSFRPKKIHGPQEDNMSIIII
jgi:hypothetical protein